MVAPVTPTVVPLLTAEAEVKVTVPKSANGTSEQESDEVHSSKSSTIHSALYSQREPSATLLKVSDTVVPVVKFSMTAEPPVLELAVTVILIESPAEMVIPEKVSRRRVRKVEVNPNSRYFLTYKRNQDTTHTRRHS